MSKYEMLEAMVANGYDHNTTTKSSYFDVKEEYDCMIDEHENAEYDMYPNGRDYDSEDWG